MYLIKDLFDLSLVEIGRLFGGRDHSTVIHSISKVEEEMEDGRGVPGEGATGCRTGWGEVSGCGGERAPVPEVSRCGNRGVERLWRGVENARRVWRVWRAWRTGGALHARFHRGGCRA